MSETKLDLDHLQAVAEEFQVKHMCGCRCGRQTCICSERGEALAIYRSQLMPPTVLALIEMAREGERLREQFETVCRVGFNHCAKDAPVFDKIEAVTGLDLRKYGWSVGQ